MRAQKFLQTNEYTAIAGNDTDFFVYRDCKCIIDFESLLESRVAVYSQATIASWLGFDESDYEG